MTLTPEQIADGWLPHDGGPCPVSYRCWVMYRDGKIETASPTSILWHRAHQNDPNAIIAYKPEPTT